MNTYGNTYHKDGTITYWSVYKQQWVQRAKHIPSEELAAMALDILSGPQVVYDHTACTEKRHNCF